MPSFIYLFLSCFCYCFVKFLFSGYLLWNSNLSAWFAGIFSATMFVSEFEWKYNMFSSSRLRVKYLQKKYFICWLFSPICLYLSCSLSHTLYLYFFYQFCFVFFPPTVVQVKQDSYAKKKKNKKKLLKKTILTNSCK